MLFHYRNLLLLLLLLVSLMSITRQCEENQGSEHQEGGRRDQGNLIGIHGIEDVPGYNGAQSATHQEGAVYVAMPRLVNQHKAPL